MLVICVILLLCQSATREFQLVNSDPFRNRLIALPGPGLPSVFEANVSSEDAAAPYSAQIMTATVTNIQEYYYQDSSKPGSDFYSCPLVPDIRTVLSARSTGQQQLNWDASCGWVDVSRQSQLVDLNAYTSFAGNCLQPFDTNYANDTAVYQVLGNYQYATDYLAIDCEIPELCPFEDFPVHFPSSDFGYEMTGYSLEAPFDLHGNHLRSFEAWVSWTKDLDDGLSGNGSARMVCNISSIDVDFKSHCTSAGCYPQSIRFVNDTSLERATNYSTPFDNDDFAASFLGNLSPGNSFGDNYSDKMGTLVWVILTKYGLGMSYSQYIATTVNPELQQCFNNFYISSQSYMSILPNMPEILQKGTDGFYIGVNLYGAPYNPHYQILWQWITIDTISSCMMLIAAILSVRLRMKTLIPDIRGYVSTLTRNNCHLAQATPDSGTGLSGTERSRMLKSFVIKIGDISGDNTNIAEIGVASAYGKGSHDDSIDAGSTRVGGSHYCGIQLELNLSCLASELSRSGQA